MEAAVGVLLARFESAREELSRNGSFRNGRSDRCNVFFILGDLEARLSGLLLEIPQALLGGAGLVLRVCRDEIGERLSAVST
jgi:hypothetical protein